jgi:hypothetical protein
MQLLKMQSKNLLFALENPVTIKKKNSDGYFKIAIANVPSSVIEPLNLS